MSKNEARGNQRQSEAIRGNQLLVIQRPSEAIGDHQMQSGRTSGAIRRNQTQSDAIRRNQTQSACPEHCVFRVFVFWAGRKGLCFVFLCFGLAQRACVLCFRVLADPPQNTARGQETHQKERRKSWAFLLTVKRDTHRRSEQPNQKFEFARQCKGGGPAGSLGRC